MKAAQIGSSIASYLGRNAVNIAAGGVTIAAGAAVAAAGTKAVTTACLAGGGIVAAFVTFNAAKGMVTGLMLTPAAVKDMYGRAREAMTKPSPIVQAA